jgi:hypothetical protein
MDEHRLETLPGRFPALLRDYAEKFNAREYMTAQSGVSVRDTNARSLRV